MKGKERRRRKAEGSRHEEEGRRRKGVKGRREEGPERERERPARLLILNNSSHPHCKLANNAGHKSLLGDAGGTSLCRPHEALYDYLYDYLSDYLCNYLGNYMCNIAETRVPPPVSVTSGAGTARRGARRRLCEGRRSGPEAGPMDTGEGPLPSAPSAVVPAT